MKHRDVPQEARPKSFGVSQHPCNELVLEMQLERLMACLQFGGHFVALVAERKANLLEKKLLRP